MTLPRLRPTVREHLKHVEHEFEKALELCVKKAIEECNGPPTLSVENSEGLIVCKMLAGGHADAKKTFGAGDVAPILRRDYQEGRWEAVGDGDLFVQCFRPHVIRLIREHLAAYREALPDRQSFCNSLDEIERHLLAEHFGVRYFTGDLQSGLDEWEEQAWQEEPEATGVLSGEGQQDEPTRRKRGRPSTIPHERKLEALKAKATGGSYRDCAKILYQLKRPSDQQVRGVLSILKRFTKTHWNKVRLCAADNPRLKNYLKQHHPWVFQGPSSGT